MVDLILSGVADLVASALNLVIKLILPAFGFTFDSFARAFPFAAISYGIFQRVALAIILVVSAWHMIPFLLNWFGIRSNELKSTPLRQLFQSVLAVIMVYYGNHILSAIIEIAQYPFNALLNANYESSWSLLDFDMNPVVSAFNDLFYQTSILLYLILLLMIGFNLIKVLLEAIERYVVLFVLIYLSPLASSALASEETSGIFKRFFVMFLSQCLLLLLNVWTVKMAISMFAGLGANNVPILGLLMGYAFLRISLRMDSYINQLGLNAAVTGAGLGMELLAAGATALGGVQRLMGAGGGGASSGSNTASSPVLGLRDKIAGAYSKYMPGGAISDTAHAALQGMKTGVRNYSMKAQKNAGGGTGTGQASGKTLGNKPSFTGSIGSSIAYEMEGVDNIYSRMAHSSQNAAAVSAFSAAEASSEPPINPTSGADQKAPAVASANDTSYNAYQRLVSNNPYSAATVMEKFAENGHSTSDSKNVSAVLEGIGARRASPTLKKFVEVGNGTDQNVKGTPKFVMDKDGIHASFIKDGAKETLELRNSNQFNTLNYNEKKSYQQFKAKNGDTYYYRTEKTQGIAMSIRRRAAENMTGTANNQDGSQKGEPDSQYPKPGDSPGN